MIIRPRPRSAGLPPAGDGPYIGPMGSGGLRTIMNAVRITPVPIPGFPDGPSAGSKHASLSYRSNPQSGNPDDRMLLVTHGDFSQPGMLYPTQMGGGQVDQSFTALQWEINVRKGTSRRTHPNYFPGMSTNGGPNADDGTVWMYRTCQAPICYNEDDDCSYMSPTQRAGDYTPEQMLAFAGSKTLYPHGLMKWDHTARKQIMVKEDFGEGISQFFWDPHVKKLSSVWNGTAFDIIDTDPVTGLQTVRHFAMDGNEFYYPAGNNPNAYAFDRENNVIIWADRTGNGGAFPDRTNVLIVTPLDSRPSYRPTAQAFHGAPVPGQTLGIVGQGWGDSKGVGMYANSWCMEVDRTNRLWLNCGGVRNQPNAFGGYRCAHIRAIMPMIGKEWMVLMPTADSVVPQPADGQQLIWTPDGLFLFMGRAVGRDPNSDGQISIYSAEGNWPLSDGTDRALYKIEVMPGARELLPS